jgi:hypothetical protein
MTVIKRGITNQLPKNYYGAVSTSIFYFIIVLKAEFRKFVGYSYKPGALFFINI